MLRDGMTERIGSEGTKRTELWSGPLPNRNETDMEIQFPQTIGSVLNPEPVLNQRFQLLSWL